MEIRRTYREKSLRRGLVETVDEARAREVFGQTGVAFHADGACGNNTCGHCADYPMSRLLKGEVIKTFFSEWELIAAPALTGDA